MPSAQPAAARSSRARQRLWTAAASAMSVFLVLACGGDENARPFGADTSHPGDTSVGGAGRGAHKGEGLVRGAAGATGTLDVGVGDPSGAGGAGATAGANGTIDMGTGGSPSASGGQSGSGGLADAGVPSSGGRSASGGSSQSGGVSGTGGGRATSSGGAPASGTGGARTSSGGVSGSGGARAASGGAMAPGTGGATGTTAECQHLMDDYDAELQKARMCKDGGKDGGKDPGKGGDGQDTAAAGGADTCGAPVPAKLAGCGSTCTTYVDNPKALEDIRKKWTMAGCTAPACTGMVCKSPHSAACSPAGVCLDNP